MTVLSASSTGRPSVFATQQIADEKTAVRQTVKSFADLRETLIGAQDDGQALDHVITSKPGWDGLWLLVATAARLTDTMVSDPLRHILSDYFICNENLCQAQAIA